MVPRRRIGAGDESWHSMVPSEDAALIVKRGFFGCREAQEAART